MKIKEKYVKPEVKVAIVLLEETLASSSITVTPEDGEHDGSPGVIDWQESEDKKTWLL